MTGALGSDPHPVRATQEKADTGLARGWGRAALPASFSSEPWHRLTAFGKKPGFYAPGNQNGLATGAIPHLERPRENEKPGFYTCEIPDAFARPWQH